MTERHTCTAEHPYTLGDPGADDWTHPDAVCTGSDYYSIDVGYFGMARYDTWRCPHCLKTFYLPRSDTCHTDTT